MRQSSTWRFLGAAIGLCAIAAAGPSAAQKSAMTVRIALEDPIRTVDELHDPKPENTLLSSAIYNALINYDATAQTFRPAIAKSWKRIDPTTLEFELRDDLAWHDGQPIVADDVVNLIKWGVDPETKFQRKNVYSFLKGAEKTGPHTVRVLMEVPTAVDMIMLAQVIPVYPNHIWSKLDDKSAFGRNPVGSGPYKVASIERNTGFIAEKWSGYKMYGYDRTESNVRRMVALPIPDMQTQIAQLITGNIDMVRDLTADQARALADNKNFKLTVVEGLVTAFVQLDASGRSGRTELKDPRVRRALHMAIDRKTIATDLVWGGGKAQPIDALCLKRMVGCEYTTKPVAYDPVAAKKLLAEAGYPNGFEIEIFATTGRNGRTAEAIANYLAAIGMKTSVQVMNFATLSRFQRDGKLEAYVATFPTAIPDIHVLMDRFFTPGRRDFTEDPILNRLREDGEATNDLAKRKEIYRQALDLVNQKDYLLPLSNVPVLFSHAAGLTLKDTSIGAYGLEIYDINWN
jgi:peptide/nickel transport system substrate-binding protein